MWIGLRLRLIRTGKAEIRTGQAEKTRNVVGYSRISGNRHL